MPDLPGGTVTLLFTDIEGSTRLLQQQGAHYGRLLTDYRELLRAIFQRHDGQEVDTQGDSFFVAFGRAADALAAAVAIQRVLARHPWPAGVRMATRMGLHTGEPQLQPGGYVGLDVHRAARLMAAGHGGQVLLSEATVSLVRHDLGEGVSLRDLGEHRLKDLLHPERIFQLVIAGLPADFPALKTLDSRRTNLPAQPTPLIGRAREIALLTELLRRGDVRLVTLTGPGGIGKTRLALQVAAELLDDYPDGTYFINLAPISDPALVASTIAQTLGVKERGGQPLVDDLKAALRDKRLLLLLDNFEQVVDAAPLIADLLTAAPHLNVLVTSRAVLHLRGEHEVAVPPLALPPLEGSGVRGQGSGVPTPRSPIPDPRSLTQYDAVRLFVTRAQAARADFAITNANAPTIAEICHRLDGLPLAIELAAARVKLFPPETLLARLGSRLQLLTGGPRDLPARQQTLRNTIGWSYDLLDAGTQALFRRLGVFVGGCTLEAAEAIGNATEDLPLDVLDGLTLLVDNSLLKSEPDARGEPRVRMLETIREFAVERLAASGEGERLRQAHARYFVVLVEEPAPNISGGAQQSHWRERLEQEHDNFRAALRWSLTGGDPDTGVRLLSILNSLWTLRWHDAEDWEKWGAAAAALHVTLGKPRSSYWANVLRLAAIFAGQRGEHMRANVLFAESLAMHKEIGDRGGMAATLTYQGRMARDQGDYERAGRLEERALTLAREAGDQGGVTWALLNLGDVALDQGDLASARTRLEEALSICRVRGELVRAAWVLLNLGRIARVIGNAGEARKRLEESLALFQRLGSPGGVAAVFVELGYAAQTQGDDAQAVAHYRTSLTILQQGDRKHHTAEECLEGLAAILGTRARGDAPRAARLLGAATALRAALGAPLKPVARAAYEQAIAAIRTQLNEATFAAVWAEGQAMTLEQAIAEALGEAAGDGESPRSSSLFKAS